MLKSATKPQVKGKSIFALNESNPLVPYLYLIPHAILFLVFFVYPIGYGVWISVHRWDPLNTITPFVGLEFYLNLFDPNKIQAQFFWKSVVNTSIFVVLSVPALIIVALLLAVQLQKPILFRGFFRTVFFAPGILSVSVVAILWRWVFDNGNGLVNVIRRDVFNLPIINYMTDENIIWLPIVVATVWWTVGFNMNLYLAAMSGISQSYYEAADLDGASPFQKFWHITLPLLQPTTLFVAVTTVLASFNLYGQSLLMTNGGPSRLTQSVIHYITEEGFTNNQFSSATAMSFVFGIIMLAFTAIQFRMMAKDVTRSREN
ncbi:carbohydrate ABC transporter permease [Deinococcus misasensis]|uniref:carbohydrate ABC transporter permease n=1 Tax=Deinococcus misasensis TaxID=392413 RepID=UPI00054ED662|nr:sugar ABC transporter permease [Deinococcus misasensis]